MMEKKDSATYKVWVAFSGETIRCVGEHDTLEEAEDRLLLTVNSDSREPICGYITKVTCTIVRTWADYASTVSG